MKFVILVVWLIAISTSANTSPSHLEPCRSGYDGYMEKFESLVRQSSPEDPLLAANIFPSFSAESTVRIIQVDSSYVVALVEFDESLWHAAAVEEGQTIRWDFVNASVKSKTYRSTISYEVVTYLTSEWYRSVDASRESELLGLDGTDYYEFVLRTLKCARAWSPRPSSRNGMLVNVVNQLSELAKRNLKSPDEQLEREIMEAVRSIPIPE